MIKIIRGIESITLFSQNATKLADFYKKILGLKQTMEAEMGEGKKAANLYGFEMKTGSPLYVVDHSDIKGKAKQPKRIVFNLEVDKIDPEVARLKRKKVKVIEPKYHVQGYGYIATFADIDGNYFQLVQVRA